MTGKHL